MFICGCACMFFIYVTHYLIYLILLTAASKAEGAEMKKYKKEMQKWKLGKYTLKSIVGEIDKKVVELGSIGGRIFRYLCFFLSSSLKIVLFPRKYVSH